VKTPAQNFGNDRISDMEAFDKMSRRIQWFKNEFLHSLSPEPTTVGAGSWRFQRCHELVAPKETFAARTVIAVAVHVASRRWLGFYC